MDGGDWGTLIGAALVIGVIIWAAIHNDRNGPTAA